MMAARPARGPFHDVCQRAIELAPSIDPHDLARYLDAVLEWNARIPLVSRANPTAVIARLALQSIAMYGVVLVALGRAPRRVLDLGSGAGFPGLVWALANPPQRTVLVERRARKAAFLERMVRVLGVASEVYAQDIVEVAAKSAIGQFDCGVTLAVGPPSVTIRRIAPLLVPGGVAVTSWPARGAIPPDNLAGLKRDRRAGAARYADMVSGTEEDRSARAALPEHRATDEAPGTCEQQAEGDAVARALVYRKPKYSNS